MKKIIPIVFLTISSLLLFGCEDEYKTNALVDDVAGGARTGYKLIKVDGQNVERIQHTTFVTRVPFAILKEGTHDLLFEKDWDDVDGPQSITLSASVQAGKMYRLERNGDELKLIIDETY